MIHEASAPPRNHAPKRPPRDMVRQAKHTPQRAPGGSLSQPGDDDHDDEPDHDAHVKTHHDDEDEEDDNANQHFDVLDPPPGGSRRPSRGSQEAP